MVGGLVTLQITVARNDYDKPALDKVISGEFDRISDGILMPMDKLTLKSILRVFADFEYTLVL
jgi:hypothetical protein